jgi:hypothetical protein
VRRNRNAFLFTRELVASFDANAWVGAQAIASVAGVISHILWDNPARSGVRDALVIADMDERFVVLSDLTVRDLGEHFDKELLAWLKANHGDAHPGNSITFRASPSIAWPQLADRSLRNVIGGEMRYKCFKSTIDLTNVR